MNAALIGVLAQAPPGSERGEEFGKTSPIALVVILLLLVATIFLIRSMGKHLRKVPESFEKPEDDGAGDAADGAGDAADRTADAGSDPADGGGTGSRPS